MDVLPISLAGLLAGAFLALLGLVLLLNVFGLPANWLLLGLVALWKWLHPAADMDLVFWAMLVGLALLGEALEMGLQIVNARRFGSSTSGTFAGMLGAFVGAICLAPLFFGLGALLGAMIGAWAGCFCLECLKGRPLAEALRAAMGAMMGRLVGTICKCGAGGAMLALAAQRIWPGAMPVLLPPQPPAAMREAALGVFLYGAQGMC